jgi:hypothetical protein
LGDGVGDNAVKSDESEDQREAGKEAEENGKKALLLEFRLLLYPLIERSVC